jgi:hypothetical protein
MIETRPVAPGGRAATIHRRLGVPLDAVYHDHSGRPQPILGHGEPIGSFFQALVIASQQ